MHRRTAKDKDIRDEGHEDQHAEDLVVNDVRALANVQHNQLHQTLRIYCMDGCCVGECFWSTIVACVFANAECVDACMRSAEIAVEPENPPRENARFAA